MTTEGATDGEWRHSDGEKGLLQPTDDVQVSGPRRVRNRDKVVSNAQRKDQRRRQRTLIAQLDKVREQEERERERERARERERERERAHACMDHVCTRVCAPGAAMTDGVALQGGADGRETPQYGERGGRAGTRRLGPLAAQCAAGISCVLEHIVMSVSKCICVCEEKGHVSICLSPIHLPSIHPTTYLCI